MLRNYSQAASRIAADAHDWQQNGSAPPAGSHVSTAPSAPPKPLSKNAKKKQKQKAKKQAALLKKVEEQMIEKDNLPVEDGEDLPNGEERLVSVLRAGIICNFLIEWRRWWQSFGRNCQGAGEQNRGNACLPKWRLHAQTTRYSDQ